MLRRLDENRARPRLVPIARALSLVLIALAVMSGCTSKPAGPELLAVASADYSAAFDAAVEAARLDGLPSVLRDRRAGVIETQSRVAGSVLEPWRTDNATLGQSFENTLAYQRRRARFEFAPVGFSPPDSDSATPQALTGADVVNAAQPPVDLTAGSSDLELRVLVYLERATVPGQRRSTWTRSKATQTQLVYPEGMKDRKGITMNWTPVARDHDYERRLLQQVQKLLADRGAIPAETQPLAQVSEPSGAQSE